jgi:hypothetical protein
MNNQRVVQTNSLPPNNVTPLEPGASNIFQSASLKSTNQNQLQSKLTNQSGGTRRRLLRGGGSVPVISVTPAPSYAVNKDATNANNMQLSQLANTVGAQSALDGTVGGTQAQAAAISTKQQAIYNGSGGYYRRNKKGGSWHKWSCLSGGKRTKKYKKCKRCKRRKTRKHRCHR